MREGVGVLTARLATPQALSVLRVGFGVLFLWLGLLKVLPGVSPAEPLMRASMPGFLPIDAFIRFAAVWEILAGLGFISGRWPRITLLMVFATMCLTLSIPLMAPAAVWRDFPFRLTFEGEYVVKDLVIVTSALVLAASLRGHGAATEQRWMAGLPIERAFAVYDGLERPFLAWSRRHSLRLLRVALGIVFLWFGALKFVPGGDAQEGLLRAVVPFEPFGTFLVGLGVLEILLAIGLLTRWQRRLAASIALVFFGLTIVGMMVRADITFSLFPVVLTLQGQHVLKNLIFFGATMVVLTAEREQLY
jgi:uncharacterized membrane protein YkgB